MVLVVVAACGGARGTSGGGGGGGGGGDAGEDATFRVFYPDQPADGFKAKVGKRFFIKPVAQCGYANGRDARWSMTGAKLESGELPPGFTVEEGAISGTAKAPGTWTVAVRFAGVTCAGEPHEAVVVPVVITAR